MMKSIKERLVNVCIIVTVALAMLLGLEFAARAAKCAKAGFFPAEEVPSTILNRAWGRQYQSDEKGLSIGHVDYVEFREIPYRSKTITVDEDGRRPVPGNCARANAFTIWMFGGSTMFGYGAPDEFTIPAYLAEILNRGGKCVKITNFGAGSWQSSQELIQLIESLKRGHHPHAVIFYDGINDDGSVDSPGGIDPDAKEHLSRAFRDHEISFFELVAQRSVLVNAVSNRIFGIRRNSEAQARLAVPDESRARYKAVTAIYARNVRLVDLLAKEFGFSAYFFLQPYPIISGKKLSPTESRMFEAAPEALGGNRDAVRALYRTFGKQAVLKAHPGFFDISGIFDGLTDELFADGAHLLPEGNRIVAERIAREIALPPLAK